MLNQTEATSLVSSQLREHTGDDKHSFRHEFTAIGKGILGQRQILSAVSVLLKELQIEMTFQDGCVLHNLSSPLALTVTDLVSLGPESPSSEQYTSQRQL